MLAASARVRSEMAGTFEEKIQQVFELLYGRQAEEADVTLGKEFLEDMEPNPVWRMPGSNMHWRSYANEFMFVD